MAEGEFNSDHALSVHSSIEARSSARVEEPLQDAIEANEFRIIAETVKAAPTKQAAAKQLGISERTLRYKMAKMRERGFAPQRNIA